ncbi:MAG: hypothetical protein Unbinned400contig1000_17 [Prokaryotic dsDNA virus sp.]|nr:MAG: hypothetical protein Unbinned400contig1000_17 [Prokaryotic dsDNA virus sp.]|tara:strand:+ start:8653 stop:9273 length:621 start_codon:yes stop_codon:yes gene_type:complete
MNKTKEDPRRKYEVLYRTAVGLHSLDEIARIHRLLDSVQPDRILEFGTGGGMMTSALGEWAMSYPNKTVLSIDRIQGLNMETMLDLAKMPVITVVGDEYARGVRMLMEAFLEPGQPHVTRFVYCDGGNKPQEMRQFSRLLSPGDCIACHDYERTPEEDKRFYNVNPYTERVYRKQLDSLLENGFKFVEGESNIEEGLHVLPLIKDK